MRDNAVSDHSSSGHGGDLGDILITETVVIELATKLLVTIQRPALLDPALPIPEQGR